MNVKYGETEMGVGTVVGADIIAGFTGFDANNMKKAMGAAMDGLRTAVTGLALGAIETSAGIFWRWCCGWYCKRKGYCSKNGSYL